MTWRGTSRHAAVSPAPPPRCARFPSPSKMGRSSGEISGQTRRGVSRVPPRLAGTPKAVEGRAAASIEKLRALRLARMVAPPQAGGQTRSPSQHLRDRIEHLALVIGGLDRRVRAEHRHACTGVQRAEQIAEALEVPCLG